MNNIPVLMTRHFTMYENNGGYSIVPYVNENETSVTEVFQSFHDASEKMYSMQIAIDTCNKAIKDYWPLAMIQGRWDYAE